MLHTLRVYFHSLRETNALEKINKSLADERPIEFIRSFTTSLSKSFEHLSQFFGKDERENFAIHSLITLGRIGVALPFVIKAYRYRLTLDEISKLWSLLQNSESGMTLGWQR